MKMRLNLFQNKIKEQGIDAFLVSQLQNIRYLCNFTGDTGWLIVSPGDAWLCVDARFTEQAERETTGTGVTIQQISGDVAAWLIKFASSKSVSTLGFEPSATSYSQYQALGDAGNKNKLRLIPLKDMVEPFRAVKDKEELEAISQAARIADNIFEYISQTIKPGMTEKSVAWEMEKFARENGSQNIPFEFIVASGPNSAMAHASPTNRIIGTGEPVMIDIGARVSGYCSDFSRTVCLGRFDDNFRKIYDIVLAAQLNAIESIKTGFSGSEADSTARLVIEKAGYGKDFIHGLGHGVGLMVHESPRVGSMSNDILTDGMVFTIEPGLYIKGWGGIRIEDTAVLENGKVRSLAKASKLLNI